MPTIYVLKLEDEKYYVGRTEYFENRHKDHLKGIGSAWTKKYKPIEILEKTESENGFNELSTTLYYMKKYGIENVRGADYVQISLPQEQLTEIDRHICNEGGLCVKCHGNHFITNCPQKEGKIVFFKKILINILCSIFCCRRNKKGGSNIINFGKHKGETFEDVLEKDKSYCLWVLRQSSNSRAFVDFQKWCRENL